MVMEIVTLAAGDRAPADADWIAVEPLDKSRYNVAGCVGGEHELAFASEMFESLDLARLAGIMWARHRGATRVFVETAEPSGAGVDTGTSGSSSADEPPVELSPRAWH